MFVVGTATAETGHGAAKGQSAAKSGGHSGAHWSYSGAGGPENWGKLSSGHPICGTGSRQSPINVASAVTATMAGIEVSYKPTPLAIVNNGHTIQVNYKPGSHMRVGNRTYRLLQFHFHAPSEHTVNGAAFDAEVHFVHKSDDGKLAVLGILIRVGAENRFLKPIWERMPTSKGFQNDHSVTVDPNTFIPAKRAYRRYFGSLTTPPCSEGVNWFLLKTPIEMSRAQLERFRQIVGVNNRPAQKAQHRFILQSE